MKAATRRKAPAKTAPLVLDARKIKSLHTHLASAASLAQTLTDAANSSGIVVPKKLVAARRDSARFEIFDDGSFIDWRECLHWGPYLSADYVNYEQAEKRVADYAAKSGNEGFVMPDLPQLETLRDLTQCNPAVDPAIAKIIRPNFHWSASACVANRAAQWGLLFSGGASFAWARTSGYGLVRPVRPVARPGQ